MHSWSFVQARRSSITGPYDRLCGSNRKSTVLFGLATILREPAIRPSIRLDECVGLMAAVEVEPVSRSVDTDRLFIRNQTTRSSMNSVPEGFLAALRICRRNEAHKLLLHS
jgi:hypothetical protein